ncbi:hypothetical protein [Streptomyces sp. NBC_00525]|uniref:hypothetical protein n=1 Tax=Streptomyces sp. NBC_00525 TaxID=2903660 RepID=UPI002E804670|nr:hypothetical protein [Streptomyces sp. NBC_00525]WUC95196.1 hypothetical protein OG710_17100 [Streptomyces sp. NBC_00525]
MNYSRKVDQDDVVRARNVLLASGYPTASEEVDACRVLSRVSPAAYLPRLARSLQRLSYDSSVGEWHPSALALCEEAVAAARSIDPAVTSRADVLYQALDSCQRQLYRAGRRAEGLAMRAEMLALGRARAAATGGSAARGLGEWAAGLSEEGRYAEAADAMTELATAILPDGPRSGALAWTLLQWIAALHDAGRFDEALAAFETLVRMEEDEAENDRGPMACHLYSLIGYAHMLDANGRGEQAAHVRQDALALLTELAVTGERRTWSGYQVSFWVVVLTMLGADNDRSASDGPRPPSGTGVMEWSSDTAQRYFDSRHALREEVDALAPRAAEDPDRHLAELVRLHRVLTVRSAVYLERCTQQLAGQAGPLFDHGVDLARRLARHDPVGGPRTLARLLIDRSTFHTVTYKFGPALEDFRQALNHLGEGG